ncbi:hypothetical protein [Paenibacillus sp. YN15]|nr:hypothetical protein [Paenibacillus sp. YN15]
MYVELLVTFGDGFVVLVHVFASPPSAGVLEKVSTFGGGGFVSQ